MKSDIKNEKENMLLGFIILLLVIALCSFLYINGYIKSDNIDGDMNINTIINFDGGTDSLSKELQNLIPYVTINNKDYKTAYQDKYVTISDINNDILLTKGIYSTSKNNLSANQLIDIISNMYGNDIFIVNKSFTVNGKNYCNYENDTYTCEILEYDGILYKADRDINGISISDNKLYLEESILFYSEEIENNITNYNVYDNGLYTNIVISFTSDDVENDGLNFDEYIDKHLGRRRIDYISSFVINGNYYNWISTEVK